MENILWVLWFWAEGDEVLDDEVWDDELEDDDVDHTVCDAQEEGVLFYKEFNQISILNSIHCLWRLKKDKIIFSAWDCNALISNSGSKTIMIRFIWDHLDTTIRKFHFIFSFGKFPRCVLHMAMEVTYKVGGVNFLLIKIIVSQRICNTNRYDGRQILSHLYCGWLVKEFTCVVIINLISVLIIFFNFFIGFMFNMNTFYIIDF